jgi:hypothetical protein
VAQERLSVRKIKELLRLQRSFCRIGFQSNALFFCCVETLQLKIGSRMSQMIAVDAGSNRGLSHSQ